MTKERRLTRSRLGRMKVGQLLSMDSGHLLSPELSGILAQLSENAHQMPLGQVADVLERAWGAGWDSNSRQSARNSASRSVAR